MKFQITSAILLLALAASPISTASVLHSIGIARDVSDETIRYIEHHQYLASGDHLVTYFDRDGEIMATKAMTYPGLPQHPEITQSDFTRDMDVKTYSVDHVLHMIRNRSGREEAYEIPLDESTIVDAGFDYFLRDNWRTFDEGVPRSFKFAVAGQKRLLDVEITKRKGPADTAVFTIEPRNFVVRLVLPKIRVVYGPDRRLLAYEGVSNLRLPTGQPRNVSIEFNHYSSAGRLARPLARWLPQQEGW
jgi:hypothetical protein